MLLVRAGKGPVKGKKARERTRAERRVPDRSAALYWRVQWRRPCVDTDIHRTAAVFDGALDADPLANTHPH
jgi:hypothetical protein